MRLVGGRTLAVDPSGHIAAVTGFTAPDRLVLPADLSAESTWLPALGAVSVEPLPGGWLVRLGDERPTATEFELDLRDLSTTHGVPLTDLLRMTASLRRRFADWTETEGETIRLSRSPRLIARLAALEVDGYAMPEGRHSRAL